MPSHRWPVFLIFQKIFSGFDGSRVRVGNRGPIHQARVASIRYATSMPLFREPLYQPGGNTFLGFEIFWMWNWKDLRVVWLNPRPMSTWPFTVKYGSTSAAKKTQTKSPNLDNSNLNYFIPGHINRWEGTFKPLAQRRMISLNQTNFYQILHTAPSSYGNLEGRRRCKRMFPQVTDP